MMQDPVLILEHLRAIDSVITKLRTKHGGDVSLYDDVLIVEDDVSSPPLDITHRFVFPLLRRLQHRNEISTTGVLA